MEQLKSQQVWLNPPLLYDLIRCHIIHVGTQSLRSGLSTTHLSNATAYAALYATYVNGSAYSNAYAALRNAGFGSRKRKHPLIPAPD